MSVQTDIGRLLAKVEKTKDGCWQWRGATNYKGYGHFRFNGTTWFAHRASYTLLVGPIPEGLTVDHLCRNRACVNPEHLEPVIHAENVRRGNTGITWSSRSHCKRGHPFAGPNLGIRSDGCGRFCRECHREASRRYKEKQALLAEPAEAERLGPDGTAGSASGVDELVITGSAVPLCEGVSVGMADAAAPCAAQLSLLEAA